MSVAAAALSGPCSVLSAVVGAVGPVDDRVLSVDFGSGPVAVLGGGAEAGPARPRRILVRPDWVREGGPLVGRTTAVDFRGPHTDYRITTAAGSLLLRLVGPPRHAVDEVMSWTLERAWVVSTDRPTSPAPEPPAESAQPRATIAPE